MDDDLVCRLRHADQIRREALRERHTVTSSFECRLREFESIFRRLYHDRSRAADRLEESVLIAQDATERLRIATQPYPSPRSVAQAAFWGSSLALSPLAEDLG